jgi:hypothetical protein
VDVITLADASLGASTQPYHVHTFNIVRWLDNTFPSWLMGIFIIGGGGLVTWIAVRLRHRRAKSDTPDGPEPDTDHDLTGVFVLIVMTMYAVLLAFMVFTVWTTYDRGMQASSEEGGALTALARDSVAFPRADQQELQLALRAYAQSVIRDEWPTMANGESSPVTTQLFNHLFIVADSLPATSTSSTISTELDNLSAARTTLLLASGAALPGLYWFILVLGAVISIALSVLIFTKTPRAHGLMAVAAAVLICTSLWLILEIDYPLSGDTAFRPDAFERALYVLTTLQSGQL